jgi:hypothetical protein
MQESKTTSGARTPCVSSGARTIRQSARWRCILSTTRRGSSLPTPQARATDPTPLTAPRCRVVCPSAINTGSQPRHLLIHRQELLEHAQRVVNAKRSSPAATEKKKSSISPACAHGNNGVREGHRRRAQRRSFSPLLRTATLPGKTWASALAGAAPLVQARVAAAASVSTRVAAWGLGQAADWALARAAGWVSVQGSASASAVTVAALVQAPRPGPTPAPALGRDQGPGHGLGQARARTQGLALQQAHRLAPMLSQDPARTPGPAAQDPTRARKLALTPEAQARMRALTPARMQRPALARTAAARVQVRMQGPRPAPTLAVDMASERELSCSCSKIALLLYVIYSCVSSCITHSLHLHRCTRYNHK